MSHQYFLSWLKRLFARWPKGAKAMTILEIKEDVGHCRHTSASEVQQHLYQLQTDGLARVTQGKDVYGETIFDVLPTVVIDTAPQPVWIDTSNPSHLVNHAADRLYVGCDPGDEVKITVEQLLWLLEQGGNKRVAARKVFRRHDPFIELMRESENWVPELLGAYPKLP